MAGNVARMGGRRPAYSVLVEGLRERAHLEDPGVDGRIILKHILKEEDRRVLTGYPWLMISLSLSSVGPVANATDLLQP